MALSKVSLRVSEGETIGVVGPNGAGKSTMLLTVAGALAPTSGTISFQGESIAGRRPEDLARLGIALVPERRHIFGELTVQENLLVGTAARSDKSGISSDLSTTFEKFPILRDRLRAAGATLSGGEQQQLAIARALLARPRLLLIDEPSLGLAPVVVDRLFEVLAELRREGVTILLVEQNVMRAAHLADRIYVLSSGRIQFQGSGPELLNRVDITGVYLGAERKDREASPDVG